MKQNLKRNTEIHPLTDTLIVNVSAELAIRNWSLKTLADKADLPYETVKKLLGYKIQRPSLLSIWQIANALDCSIDRLTGRDDRSTALLRQISDDLNQLSCILDDLETISENEHI